MKQVMYVIFDIQWAIIGVATVARIGVFCYWRVRGAWDDEKCRRSGGHNYEVVVTDKQGVKPEEALVEAGVALGRQQAVQLAPSVIERCKTVYSQDEVSIFTAVVECYKEAIRALGKDHE